MAAWPATGIPDSDMKAPVPSIDYPQVTDHDAKTTLLPETYARARPSSRFCKCTIKYGPQR